MFHNSGLTNSKTARYVSRSEVSDLALEVAFYGGSEVGGANPNRTQVVACCLKKANVHCSNSPWIELWTKEYGNLVMPDGTWNGIKLADIRTGRMFLGISNCLMEVAMETGVPKWSVQTGNTPIYHIMSAQNSELLIVFNGYYGFEHHRKLGNIAAIDLNCHEVWRAEVPIEGDIFANAPYYDNGVLKASSWNGFDCSIDERSGKIVKKEFTK